MYPGTDAAQEREYRLYVDPWRGLLPGRDLPVLRHKTGYYIDLKEFRPVTQVSLEFKQDAGSGVFIPEYLQGEVSPDGVLWYQLGQVRHGVEPFEPAVSSRNLTLTFPPVTTRYLKLSFPVEVWVFARNLSVKGYPGGTEQPAVLAMANYRHSQAAVQATEQDAGDILLVYTGSGSGEDTWSVLDFLPVVAYQDVSGKLSGRMFDTLLFLPYHGIPATRASWEAYLEDLFAPGKQLPALEEAVAKVNGVNPNPMSLSMNRPRQSGGRHRYFFFRRRCRREQALKTGLQQCAGIITNDGTLAGGRV